MTRRALFWDVVEEASRWAVPVVFPSPPVFELSLSSRERFIAPRHRAHLTNSPPGPIAWEMVSPLVTWGEPTNGYKLRPQALLHEVVHAIVWRRSGLPPAEQSDLMNLALEREALSRLGLPWPEWSRAFVVTPARRWHQTNARTKRAILDLSRQWVEDLGLMRRGLPTYDTGYDPIVSDFVADQLAKRSAREMHLGAGVPIIKSTRPTRGAIAPTVARA